MSPLPGVSLLKCHIINVWKAIMIKSWEIYISYIKITYDQFENLTNKAINVFVCLIYI